MSLLVWLPLTSNFNNQGLDNVATIIGTNTSFVTGGKIGNCCKFGYTSSFTIPSLVGAKQISIAYWMKINTATSSQWLDVVHFQATNGSNTYYCRHELYSNCTKSGWFSDCGGARSDIPCTVGEWVHYTITMDFSTGISKVYKNGTFLGNGNNINNSFYITGNNFQLGQSGLDLSINDFRVYNTILSDREIEILSRGLVCHYPLSDRSNQTPNNVATYPTFDTSSGHGGWNHWGGTGNLGHYSQNTDSQYIFRPGQTYSHCFSDESTATAPYLLYQSPSFSGGYRSLCAIIKEENGAKIKESIAYPVWNAAASGSIPSGKWTSITPLGNGFYLGKVEGFQQDGSNNLVGIYVNAGYKVYVSEFYIENDRKVCSDFFYPSTTVYDTSGYQNNMTKTGTITYTSDSARYSVAPHFINGSYLMANQNCTEYLPTDGLTVNLWIKATTWGTPISCTEGGGWNIESYNNGLQFQCYISGVGYKPAWCNTTATSIMDNKWHMLTGTFDRIAQQTKFYIDGVLKGTTATGSSNGVGYVANRLIISGEAQSTTPASSTFVGEESDVRIYATALSATQVAELYNTAVSVANNGTLLGYELVEV